ncbi:hypothetical protein APHAL10511_005157 [Amanita phalloides]|nr:hypothetical protein APHAL10511_005157 [Amanita phalloides]
MSGIDPRIKENVHFTLKGNVRFVSPDEFFENLLHGAAVGDNVNRALDVVKAKHYCEKRWNGFPLWSDEETVDEYIKPFANIVQVINEACQPYAPSDAVKTTWLDCYSESPTHRPGLPCIVQAAASTSRHVKDLNKKLSQTSKLSQDRKELLRIWWRHAHAIVDVVPRMPQDVESLQKAVVRLCAHITRLFREQPDRHFVKVLLLCSDELALWYCDHVGLVGTLNPINMHEDPDQFMRILAAFSMLSADQLGWDPMMKIYQGKGEDALPSYLLPHDRLLATTTWCISMPSEGNREPREEFVTIRQLTGFPAFICGCATMVWEAVKREDFEKGNLDMCPDTPVCVSSHAVS